MTARGLLRLEDDEKKSRFHAHHSTWLGGPVVNPLPIPVCEPDNAFVKHWRKVEEYPRGVSPWQFAFATVEQVEWVWGPRENWSEELAGDVREIMVLPQGVVDGATQSVYNRELRVV